MIFRAIVLWIAIIPLAILNGAFRERYLSPSLGPVRAKSASGVLLCVLIVAFACLAIGWLPHVSTASYLKVGALWLGLTVLFEFLFGHLVAKKSWRELGSAYTFRAGELWPLVLLVVAGSPWLAAFVRGFLQEGESP